MYMQTRAMIEIAKHYPSLAVAAGWLSAEDDCIAVLTTYNNGLHYQASVNDINLRLLFRSLLQFRWQASANLSCLILM